MGDNNTPAGIEEENGSSVQQSDQMQGQEVNKEMNNSKEMGDIVEVAVSSEKHTTLVSALKAADLVETLQGEGPFTVFAPVNSAFDALPDGTLDSLLKPENKDQLVGILTYHVIPTKAMSADVLQLIEDNGGVYEIETVAGGKLVLETSDGNVTVTDEQGNAATVTDVDLEASNGVIHVVDKVLLPKS